MSLNQLQQIEAVIREKQEVDHDRRMYQDGYKAALDELLFVVVRKQKEDPQEPPQVKPMENPVAFVLREMEKTCKSISAIPGPVSCRSSCPYYLPKENTLPDGNVTMCMRYVLKANLERMRIESGWETVNGISKSGDGYEIKGEKNHTTCNKVQRDLNGSPFCEKSEIMGEFPCDKCNIYEPKKGAEKK